MRVAIWSLFFCLAFCSTAIADVVHLSAAKSLGNALDDIIKLYQKGSPDTQFQCNYASSGALAKQITQGAPADIFISANMKWADFLADNGNLDTPSRTIFATNALVFVGDKKTGSMQDLTRLKSIAIGSPKSVPAGQYAKEAMENAGVYTSLHDAGKLMLAKDVRQALMYADRKEVDGAFVYASDARLAKNISVQFVVQQDLYAPISYPMALSVDGKKKEAAVKFYQFLQGQDAANILVVYGFTLPTR